MPCPFKNKLAIFERGGGGGSQPVVTNCLLRYNVSIVIALGLSSLPKNHQFGLEQIHIHIAGLFTGGTKSPKRSRYKFRSIGRFQSS